MPGAGDLPSPPSPRGSQLPAAVGTGRVERRHPSWPLEERGPAGARHAPAFPVRDGTILRGSQAVADRESARVPA